jgi:hypothetical protein
MRQQKPKLQPDTAFPKWLLANFGLDPKNAIMKFFVPVLSCLVCITAVAFLGEAFVRSSGAYKFESVELMMGTGHDVYIPLQTNGILTIIACDCVITVLRHNFSLCTDASKNRRIIS